MKRLLAGYLSWLLAFLSAPFFPSPAYAAAVATQLQANCIDTSTWTPRVAKAYAKALMKWNYPNWNRSEWSALSKLWGKESYYPVNDDKNQVIYNKYFNLIKDEHNVYFGGRMGSYKYLNMDQTIDLAIELNNSILSE